MVSIEIRRKRSRECHARKRANETPAEREKRLFEMRVRAKKRRDKLLIENPEQLHKKEREQREKRREKFNKSRRTRIYLEKVKVYRQKNREKILRRRRELWKESRKNLGKVIENRLRSRISTAIKRGVGVKSNRTMQLIGCTVDYLIDHLVAKMPKDMKREDLFTKKVHIDHIKPVSGFDLTKISEQKACFNFTNLQPLWAFDNLSKGDRI